MKQVLSLLFLGIFSAPLCTASYAQDSSPSLTFANQDEALNYQVLEQAIVGPLVTEAIQKIMADNGPTLDNPSDHAPDTECSNEEPPNEVEIKDSGGGILRLKRNPKTGRVDATIIFPQWWMPNFRYHIICTETAIPGQAEPERTCEVRNNFGLPMCSFTHTPPGTKLRMQCDSDILGLKNDCDLEEKILPHGPNDLPTPKLCLTCRYIEKDGERRENTPEHCSPMKEWQDRLRQGIPRSIYDGITPLIPEWFPIFPNTLPSLFPKKEEVRVCPLDPEDLPMSFGGKSNGSFR
jgi:hypothetical protein